MRKVFFILLFFFFLSSVIGQDYKKIDSLKQILRTQSELNGTNSDTIRIKTIIAIAGLFEKTSPDSAVWYYNSVVDSVMQSYSPSILLYEPRYTLIAHCITKQVSLLFYNFKYKEAGIKLESALTIYSALNNQRMVARCFNTLGLIENNLNNYPKAILYFEKALVFYTESGDKKSAYKCYNSLGNISRTQGNYVEAISYFEKAYALSVETNDKKGIATHYLNMGVLEFTQGNYTKARESYEKAKSLFEELRDKDGLASTCNNLGIITTYLADYPAAIGHYEQCLKMNEEAGDKKKIPGNLHNLAIVSVSQGNYEEAQRTLLNVVKMCEDYNDVSGLASCYNDLGIATEKTGNFDLALSYYYKTLEIANKINDVILIATCHANIGKIDSEKGNYNTANSHYKKALDLSIEFNHKSTQATCYVNMGDLAFVQGDISEAITMYHKSLSISDSLGEKASVASLELKLAKAYLKTGRNDEALSLMEKSGRKYIELMQHNFTVMSEKDKETYTGIMKEVFNALLELEVMATMNLIDIPDGEKSSLTATCFNNELIMKGLLLNTTRHTMDAVVGSNNNEIQNAYWLLRQYRNKISQIQASGDNNNAFEIDSLETLANEKERLLVSLSAEYAGINKQFHYSFNEVKAKLKKNEAAIEFVRYLKGNNSDTAVYAALVLLPGNEYPVTVYLFDDTDLYKLSANQHKTGMDYINRFYNTQSQTLYNLIWKPIDSLLKEINTVYYAPAGILNNISFSAISTSPGVFLSDKYHLVQLGSTGLLINTSQKTGGYSTAAVFGGIQYNHDTVKHEVWQYLPGTLNEKVSIEKQLKKNKIPSQTFSGKEAKEETFKALYDTSVTPSILHVSTHGFFYPDPSVQSEKQSESEETEVQFRGSSGFGNWMFVNNKNPMMRSGLVFASANRVWSEDWGRTDNEGVLTAYEVSNMNMRNTQLVVLSACETGLGDIRGSEGVYGLQRAFKMAGVKYIIMSLWQVPDKETVEFMELFYRKLLKSKDVRKSFNETQKEMRKKYDPYYWAAFVLIE